MKKWYHTRKRKMKAYGRNLRFIEDRQYDDAMHSKMVMPTGKHKGLKRKRYLCPFKKMERAHAKEQIRRERGITGAEGSDNQVRKRTAGNRCFLPFFCCVLSCGYDKIIVHIATVACGAKAACERES